jgi:hypothetical protein
MWSAHRVVPVLEKEALGGVKVRLHTFVTSVPNGGEWSISKSGGFTPRKMRLVLGGYEVEVSHI